MRTLLITGGAGFIGGNFVRYWRRRHPGDRLIVLDALTYAGNRQTIADLEAAGEIAFVHGDIVDAGLVSDTLARELSKAVGGAPVTIGNDVSVATEAEFRLGAGKPYKSILGVFWGTGVGGGIVLDGK